MHPLHMLPTPIIFEKGLFILRQRSFARRDSAVVLFRCDVLLIDVAFELALGSMPCRARWTLERSGVVQRVVTERERR